MRRRPGSAAFAGLDVSATLDLVQALKRRLLAAAFAGDGLHLHLHRKGVGHLLSRVMEAQVLESFALDGGLPPLVTLVEFGFAA